VNCRNDAAIRQRIGTAAPESFRTSAPVRFAASRANFGENGLIKTLCDEHASGQGVNGNG